MEEDAGIEFWNDSVGSRVGIGLEVDREGVLRSIRIRLRNGDSGDRDRRGYERQSFHFGIP